MKKFAGLSLILAMCVSVATAYGLSRTAQAAPHAGESDALMKNMDTSLVAKIRDYLQIIDQLQKLSKAEPPSEPANQADVLSGGQPPPAPHMPKAAPVIAPTKAPQEKPWWSDCKLSMVFYSDKSRTAVISGKFVREGDAVLDGIVVKKIDRQSVTLEHKASSNEQPSGQQDNLKTLFVKAK